MLHVDFARAQCGHSRNSNYNRGTLPPIYIPDSVNLEFSSSSCSSSGLKFLSCVGFVVAIVSAVGSSFPIASPGYIASVVGVAASSDDMVCIGAGASGVPFCEVFLVLLLTLATVKSCLPRKELLTCVSARTVTIFTVAPFILFGFFLSAVVSATLWPGECVLLAVTFVHDVIPANPEGLWLEFIVSFLEFDTELIKILCD